MVPFGPLTTGPCRTRTGGTPVPQCPGLIPEPRLVYRVFGGVTFASVHLKLHVFALLVFDLQGPAVWGDHVHFELAVGTVQFGICGVVDEGVLVANAFADVSESVHHIAGESRL